MGKVRIRTIGEEDLEQKDKANKKTKLEQKRARLESRGEIKAERAEEVSVEDKDADPKEEKKVTSQEELKEKTVNKTKKTKFIEKRIQSKRYLSNATLVSKKNVYPIDKALEVLKKFQKSKFDETIELHINVKDKGVSGQVSLPHGTGKKLSIKTADSGQVDKLIKEIESGRIDFDVLVATPEAMPKLAKVAKILGPRGLMPNPKNGTVTPNPDETIKKLSSGQVNFKTESEAPVIHLSIGKISFDDKKLSENIKAITQIIGEDKIKSITLKSTMSPGIKIELGSVSM